MDETRKQFLEELSALAVLCGENFPPPVIRIYDLVFREVGYLVGVQAVRKAIMNRRSTDRVPSPADLRRLGTGEVDDADLANEVAGRIVEAIARFGYPSPGEAEKFVGDIGWYVVRRSGGWQNLCTMLASQKSFYQSQFRDMALSAIRRVRAGQKLEAAPSFQELAPGSAPNRSVAELVERTSAQLKLGGANDEEKKNDGTR